MPGWRVGLMAAPVSLAEAVVRLISNSVSSLPDVTAAAAAAALEGDQSFSFEMVQPYRHRAELAHRELSRSPRLRCPLPTGAFYLFPDVSACFGLRAPGGGIDGDADPVAVRDDLHLAQLLLERARVAVVPGSFFGELVAEGARRMRAFVDALR
jgi:aspartate aminotransferase